VANERGRAFGPRMKAVGLRCRRRRRVLDEGVWGVFDVARSAGKSVDEDSSYFAGASRSAGDSK